MSSTVCRTAIAARWLLACCSAATLHAGCADNAPPNTVEPAPVSRQLVDDVRLARWQAWDHLAAALPDGHILSIEMLHSRPGAALAVFTVVRDHHAVQSVVEAAPQPIRLAADEDVASPDAIALGEPPPKQPPEPGIVAQGRSLLDATFSDDPVVSASIALGVPPPKQPPEPGVVAQAASPTALPATVTVSTAQVDQVRIARWHVWEQLALTRPDGTLLSVELLHSQPGASIAVFTVVRDHHAIQSVVTSGRPPQLAGTDDPISADGVAIGEEPPQPGIVAQGTSLLNAAFGTNAPAQ